MFADRIGATDTTQYALSQVVSWLMRQHGYPETTTTMYRTLVEIDCSSGILRNVSFQYSKTCYQRWRTLYLWLNFRGDKRQRMMDSGFDYSRLVLGFIQMIEA